MNLLENLEMRIAKLEKSASARQHYKLAGSGLKSVQAILPGVSDKQAGHFLHALSKYIADPDDVRVQSIDSKIGELEVIVPSMRHPHDPAYDGEDYIKGDDTLIAHQIYELDLKTLSRFAKVDLSGLNLENKRAVEHLCDALTKNINNNILRSADDEDKNLIFGDIQHELDIPYGHEINEINIDGYEFEVLDLKIKGSKLYAKIFVEVEYYILLDRTEY